MCREKLKNKISGFGSAHFCHDGAGNKDTGVGAHKYANDHGKSKGVDNLTSSQKQYQHNKKGCQGGDNGTA